MINQTELEDISKNYNISFINKNSKEEIPGSPERVKRRGIFFDKNNEKYLVETFDKSKFDVKNKIAIVLDHFSKKSDFINPIIKTKSNEYFFEINNELFQISKFLVSEKLPRPDYITYEYLGDTIFEFFVELNRFDFLFFEAKNKRRIIEKFTIDITSIIDIFEKKYSIYAKRIILIKNFLEQNLFNFLENFNITFNHGDVHPLNIIWKFDKYSQNYTINKIIDWEFCGYNFENYDLANFIGCCVIENPEYITKGLVKKIILNLKKTRLISKFSFEKLPEMIITNRIFWLNEWIRKKDFEMIDLEIVFIEILIKNISNIKLSWNIN